MRACLVFAMDRHAQSGPAVWHVYWDGRAGFALEARLGACATALVLNAVVDESYGHFDGLTCFCTCMQKLLVLRMVERVRVFVQAVERATAITSTNITACGWQVIESNAR